MSVRFRIGQHPAESGHGSDAVVTLFKDDPEKGDGIECRNFGPTARFGGLLLAELLRSQEGSDPAYLARWMRFDPPKRYMDGERIIYDQDRLYWLEGHALTQGGTGKPVVIRAEAFIGGTLHIYALNGNLVYNITGFDHDAKAYIGEWAE